MNTTTFPPKAYPQADKSATNLSVSAGITRLRRLGDGSRLKAYIKDHEAWALIVLAILLIAGTVLYVDFQPRLDAGSGTPQNGAVLKLAEAPVQQRPSELSSPLIQETPSAMSSSISNPPSQPARLISSGKRDHQLIKRKAIHHHLRR